MADGVIQVPPDSSGKMLDQESLTVGANTVYRQRVQPFPPGPPSAWSDANPAVITTATTVQLFAAAGAGLRWCITDISVSNSHASVDVTVTISDAGGTIWQGLCKAGGGGFGLTFTKPKRQTNANAVVNVVTSAAGNVLISVGAFNTVL